MTPGARQRHFERFPVEHIEGTLLVPGDLRVVDLSQTGLSFEISSPLQADEPRELELLYRQQSVRVQVAIRWVRTERNDGGQPVYRAGAEFLRVLEKSSSGLWDFILAEGAGQAAEEA